MQNNKIKLIKKSDSIGWWSPTMQQRNKQRIIDNYNYRKTTRITL